MKTSFTTLDISCIVNEIRPLLVNAWINNIYEINDLLLLRFRKEGTTRELLIEPGKRVHITKYLRKKPRMPSNKIQAMRKHLKDKKILDIYQHELDRIIVLEIGLDMPFYKLVIELFGKGNYLVVDANNRVILARTYKRMRDRDILPGKEFVMPPSPPVNILNLTKKDLKSALEERPHTKLIKIMNNLLAIGPQYAEEVLHLASIPLKKKPVELEQDAVDKLYQAIEKFKSKMFNFEPEIVLDVDEKIDETTLKEKWDEIQEYIVDVVPHHVHAHEPFTCVKISSFNDAIDSYFSRIELETGKDLVSATENKEISRIEKRLKQLEDYLQKLENDVVNFKLKGDLIYKYFSEIEDLFTALKTARDKNIPWDEIITKLNEAKDRGVSSAQILKDLNHHSGTVTLILDDMEIIIPFTKDVATIANEFYSRSKKAKRKIPGAIDAINRTRAQLEELKTSLEKQSLVRKEQIILEKPPLRWYEKYRHFMTSRGKIVVAGFDSQSNEHLVKKYLTPVDKFFHTDVHGAAAVIVKTDGEDLSEKEIEEVACFAASYSSSWNEGQSATDVFYVDGDQVTFTPPHGQYLQKGSFIIVGKRDYYKNAPLQLHYYIEFGDRWAKIKVAPGTREITDKKIITLIPGEKDKNQVSKELKDLFVKMHDDDIDKQKIKAIPIEHFMRLIPGSSRILLEKND